MIDPIPAPPAAEVAGLTVAFTGAAGPVRAVNGVDLTVRAGEVLAILGNPDRARASPCAR